MPETTICHGIEGRLYEKLERLAKAAGKTPERMRKPGTKGAPTTAAFKAAAKTAKKAK